MTRRLLILSCLLSLAGVASAQSRDTLEARIAQAPNDAAARRALSDLLRAEGEPAAAVPHLVWLADHAPTDAGLHRQLAQTLLWSDRPADAAAALAELVALDPGDVEARVQLAEIITWTGGADQAVAVLAPVADAHPDDARLHRILAFAFLAAGDPRARRQLTRALVLQPDDPDLLIESASLERWQGDWSLAYRRLQRAQALPLTPDQQARIRVLSQGIRTLSAATITTGATRVDDSVGILRTDSPLRLDVPLNGRWTVGGEIARGKIQGQGDAQAMAASYVQSLVFQPTRRVRLDAALGLDVTPGARLAVVARGAVQRVWTQRGFALARLSAQTASATDAVDALERGLRRSSVTAEGYAEPTATLALNTSLSGLAYSDGNHRVQAAGALRWLPLSVGARAEGLPLASVGVTAGMLYEDTQTIYPTSSPYYTPDDLLTVSAGLALRVVTGHFRLDGTVGAARQRAGVTQVEVGAALEYDRGTESVRVEARRSGSSAYSADVISLTARFRLP